MSKKTRKCTIHFNLFKKIKLNSFFILWRFKTVTTYVSLWQRDFLRTVYSKTVSFYQANNKISLGFNWFIIGLPFDGQGRKD